MNSARQAVGQGVGRTVSEDKLHLAFPPIQPVSLTDRVISALKDAFLEGSLKPGDAIVEREIARQMKVGTPVVREALIALQGQGFVRRVTNTGTYVTKFDTEEVHQLCTLRVELETMALQWARTRATPADLDALHAHIDSIVDAAKQGNQKLFMERDMEFHRACWKLSGNRFLAETLDRLMAPLFAFVVVASRARLTVYMAREHYDLVDALRSLPEPEFTASVRKTLSGFVLRWLAAVPHPPAEEDSQA
jgi:DNA-binding GntR family transcriptional regulator